ncbi:c-type cytochrome [Caulobacter henricii]|uniref:Cytochrome c domain-containing protein n=1 Tax=Caulobacter henricii TaxID=69395 RepID=A0A0P0P4X5_9CAUL|nr:cytochrome c [Caulobacter henricii]ALL15360.1 hypothetical protein AQ619_14560 [Caulobacter henricii]
MTPPLPVAVRHLGLVIAACAGLAACASTPGEPSASDLVARGRSLALSECAQCHAVGPSGGNARSGAPAFAKVAETYRNTRLDWELEAITQVGHYRMPRKQLTSTEITEVTAYIRSLDRSRR